jgi:hypothetical protein
MRSKTCARLQLPKINQKAAKVLTCILPNGADRAQRHPTSRSSGHRVPDLYDYSRSSTPSLLLLSRSSSLHTILHLPPVHHETSKHDFSHKTKINVQSQKCPGFEFEPSQVNDLSQSNQETDHLVSHTLLTQTPF